MFRNFRVALSAAALIAGTPALAQVADEAPAPAPATSGAYVGISAGYHDVLDNPFGKDGGAIVGGVAGFDLALTPETPSSVVIGVEGNFHLGTGLIDSEYGAAARIGYRFPSGGLAYVRGGYQEINIDIGKAINVDGIDDDDIDVDDSLGGYLVGVGGEFPLNGSAARLRVGVDTIEFDTWRPNVAVVLGF